MRILRTPPTETIQERDISNTAVTYGRDDNIETLMKAASFRHIRTLRLVHPDQKQLADLLDRLEAHKHKALTIHLLPAISLRPDLAKRLSVVYIGGLHLDYETHGADKLVLGAFSKSKFPISLRGNFTQDGLKAASCIASLTSLHMTGRGFDDQTARYFTSHRSLETVFLGVNWNLSSQGVGAIASIPTLRALSIDDWSPRWVSGDVARTLAISPQFESLEIRTKGPAVPSANFSVLSESTTLKSLRILSAPLMPYLANFRSLEHLELHNDPFKGIVCLEAASARIFTGLPNLRSLQLTSMFFKRDALATIFICSRVQKLAFCGYHWFHDGDTAALAFNDHIKELTVKDGYLPADEIVSLLRHPSLERLQINNLEFLRRPGEPTLKLRDTDTLPAPADKSDNRSPFPFPS
jgi:hypothetical protein